MQVVDDGQDLLGRSQHDGALRLLDDRVPLLSRVNPGMYRTVDVDAHETFHQDWSVVIIAGARASVLTDHGESWMQMAWSFDQLQAIDEGLQNLPDAVRPLELLCSCRAFDHPGDCPGI